tara:strand:+ start:306 stop:740 length:435 start_codon:yes stop_codon:yes gene_type:complete
MQIKEVSAKQIRKLRHITLRQGKPFSTTTYKKDNFLETFHLAVFEKNKIVSCATFYPEATKVFKSKKAYRLRGMATDLDFQKKGYGKKIMQEAFKKIQNKKGNLLWCNARLIAVDFYKKLGLKTIGEKFNISDIGPHYLMYIKL